MSNDNNNTPLASCTGRIMVVKDGKDGVGIKSADTVFCVYPTDQPEPSDDYEGWNTLYSKLTLVPSAYVWTAVKVTNTSNKSWLTGKRCLGKCEDFASIKELYALGDSNNNPPTEGWKETYSVVKGKWLWTKNELTLQNVAEKVYTTPVCIAYFAIDGINGTSFTPKGMANAHYASYKDYKETQQGPIPGEVYLIDSVADKYSDTIGPVCISYDKLVTGNEVIAIATEGDAYIIEKNLWVNNGEAWVDFGDIQGADGKPGKNAPWAVFSNNPVAFESDEKGKAKSDSKFVDLMVYLGTNIITKNCNITLEASSDANFDISKASLSNTNSDTATITINSEGIKTKNVGGYDISVPNSSLIVKVTYDDYVIKVTVNIVVDTSLVDGYFRTSIKGLEAQYTTMNKDISDQLEVHQSHIQANADAITHRVSEDTYNGDLEKTKSKFSEIEQRADKIEQSVTNLNNLTGEWEKSGIITNSNFSSMYSEAVASDGSIMKKAEMGTYVQKNDDGTLESGVKINADNININSEHEFRINGSHFYVSSTNFNVDKNGISYNDTEKSTSWSVGYSEDGLSMNFVNNDTSAVMHVDKDRGASLWMEKEKKSRAIYSNDYIGISANTTTADLLNYVIDFGIPNAYGVGYRRSTPKAGAIMEVLKSNNYLRFILAGLPKSSDDCTNGCQIYVENGFLKIKQE